MCVCVVCVLCVVRCVCVVVCCCVVPIEEIESGLGGGQNCSEHDLHMLFELRGALAPPNLMCGAHRACPDDGPPFLF